MPGYPRGHKDEVLPAQAPTFVYRIMYPTFAAKALLFFQPKCHNLVRAERHAHLLTVHL